MLHLVKLAVGARDIEHLRTIQAHRTEVDPPLRHRTRNFPRRAPEVIEGGSMYWVVSGAIAVRQHIIDVVEDRWEDGSKCAALLLDATLTAVVSRPTKPFQGWRYLLPDDAPADIRRGTPAEGEGVLPVALRQELRALCLI